MKLKAADFYLLLFFVKKAGKTGFRRKKKMSVLAALPMVLVLVTD